MNIPVYYNIAIAVAQKDRKKAQSLVDMITPKYVNIREVVTPDETYTVFYWEDHAWANDLSTKVDAVLLWLATVRHAYIACGSDGSVYVSTKTDDADGCDEIFDDLLSWKHEILINEDEVPVLTPSYRFSRDERCGIEADRLAQMFQDYVNNDLQSADTDYVRDVLYDTCGCSDEELEAVGLGFLVRDAHEETTPDGIIIQDNEAGMLAIDRAVKVEWSDCEEGIHGDFNPNDPDDVSLLRFDVYVARGGRWEAVDDASYCTQMPVDTPKPTLKRALLYLLKEYSNVLNSDPEQSVKKMGEGLSWISPDWFSTCEHSIIGECEPCPEDNSCKGTSAEQAECAYR